MLVIASLAVVVAIAVVTSVVSGFDTLGQRFAVVHFDGTVTVQQQERIQQACADPPVIRAEPVNEKLAKSGSQSGVRYRIDDATEGDIAALSKCLKGRKGVAGIELGDLTTGG